MCLSGVPNSMCPLMYRVFLCLSWLSYVCIGTHQCVCLEGQSSIWMGPNLFSYAHWCALSEVSARGSQFLCAHYCTTCSLCLSDQPKSVLCFLAKHHVYRCLPVGSNLVRTHWCTASFLERPNSVFFVLTDALCLMCLPGVSTPVCSLFFTSFMCLSGLAQSRYQCSPIRQVCKCVPVGSNFVCAHFCTASVWRSPILLSCAHQCTFSVVSAGGSQLLHAHCFFLFPRLFCVCLYWPRFCMLCL